MSRRRIYLSIVSVVAFGLIGGVKADQIVMVDWTGSVDIPDNGEYVVPHLVDTAPAGARITNILFEVLVDDRGNEADFWCSDYEIGLSSEERGGTETGYLLWDNAGFVWGTLGGRTDGNHDDDEDDDSDIDLSRVTSEFNGQHANQRWGFYIHDNRTQVHHPGLGLGCLRHLKIVLQYDTASGPYLGTRDATKVGAHTATLHGLVGYDGGELCEYQFTYGRRPARDQQPGIGWSHTQATGSVGDHDSFSQDISGLQRDTTYYFLVRGCSPVAGCGPWAGLRQFTTLPDRPTAETLDAVDVTHKTATLRGQVVDDGGGACEYRFLYREAVQWSHAYYQHAGIALPIKRAIKGPPPGWNATPWMPVGEAGFAQSLASFTPDTAYQFVAQVRNSGGLGEGATLIFQTAPAPKITNVCSRHCSPTKHVYYLAGVAGYAPWVHLEELFTVTIDWKGLTPGKVVWICPGGALEDACPSDQPCNSFSHSFDMSTGFGVGGKLTVVAIAANGVDSLPVTANFTVIEPPPQVPKEALYATSMGEEGCGTADLTYIAWLPFPVTFFNWELGGDLIPDWIPGFGGKLCAIHGGGIFFAVVGQGYATSWAVLENNGFELAGTGFTEGISVSMNWKYQNGAWCPEGVFTMQIPGYETTFARGQWGPFYAQGRVGLEDVALQIATTCSGDWSGAIRLQPWIEGDGGVGCPGVAGGELFLRGGLRMLLAFPDDPLRQFCIYITGGLRFYCLWWSWTEEAGPWYWCAVGEWDMPLCSLAASSGPRSILMDRGSTELNRIPKDLGKFTLMDRDYVGPDYAVWLPSAADGKPGKMGPTILSSLSIADTQSEEQVLQSNVFKMSLPTVAADDGELWLAWVYDDPNRSSANRTQVVFSRSDGGTWTLPRPIHDDGTADFSPQLRVLANGQVLCAWEDAKTVLPDDVNLADVVSAMEIAAASYDKATGLWTTQVLTNNSCLDRSPQIAGADNDTALVVWVCNEKNDALGQDPNAPNTIRYSLWNGSTWSQPLAAADAIGCMLRTTSLAYNGTQAVYVYAVDADWDYQTTDKDEELYALVYDGTHWSQAMRLTNDSLMDVNPQVVYDQGIPLLVWYRDGNLVSCRNLDPNNLQQIASTSSLGAMDFRLAKSPGGCISLVWTGISAESKGIDVFTATYDPLFGLWSNAYPLTSDTDTEKSLSGTYVGSDELAVAYNKDRIRMNDEGLSETYRTDLCVLRHVLASDLAVVAKDISVSEANPKPGSVVQITAVIHNLGDVAEAKVPVAFYQGDPSKGGVQIADFQIISGPIAGAGTGKASVSWTVPDVDSPQQIYVVVDPQSTFIERDRANNVACISVMAPELSVASISVEKTGHKARRITARIVNTGAMPAQNVGVAMRMDSPEGQELNRFTAPVLDPNSLQEVHFDWDIAAVDFKGSEVLVCVVVDEDQRVTESDENNNTASSLVHVSKTGDITDGGSIDYLDLFVLVDRWLYTSSRPDWLPACDLDHNGCIDLADFSIVAKDWLWEAEWHTE